ncbi:glycosyl hydrolase [Paenibacillus caui]|uniref:glycosyl hydrolase n=1 Tax=Paenibacillus caui TaxID=2873927 RepID=UPI001CA8733F|nr:glycosyl hydrolase [Paenibacillus caui]
MIRSTRMYRFIYRILSISLLLSLCSSSLGAPASWAAMMMSPVNPKVTREARELLNTLYHVSGENIIAGQHDYLESPDDQNNKLNKISGQYAGLHGYELGAISGQTEDQIARQRSSVVDSAIRWYKAGGMVSITFHESLPGTAKAWSNVQKSISQSEFDKYVTPGTAEYGKLIQDLDSVAASLKKLSDAGVPVLWRPYHEMNGDWFWWGQKNHFNKLWNVMYDRFVNVHGLNNLLWVWSPNAPNGYAEPYSLYFPGLAKVDVLAIDIYNSDFRQSYYDGLLSLAQGKPIAIGESGELPDLEALEITQNKWAYMMTWGKMLTENNSASRISTFMNSGYVLSRDKLVLVQQNVSSFAKAAVPLENGLYGEYFSNAKLSGVPIMRKDDSIQFNWRNGSPELSIPKDFFSVRWTGKIQPLYSEKYTISTLSDDGIRVWIDGNLIIDSWFRQSWVERKGKIDLSAGQLYDIKVEYYEARGDSMVKLMWESPSQSKEIVPPGALFQPFSHVRTQK